MATSLMTDAEFNVFYVKLKVQHLRLERDSEAGTAIGYDHGEVFMRALQKPGGGWIMTTYKTKHVNWSGYD